MPLTSNELLGLLTYALGGLGLAAECYAYSLHEDQRFRRWTCGAALLWSAMYLGLDALTSALTMGSTALRTALAGRLQSPRGRLWGSVFFLALFALLTAASWQGSVSLLPAFAVMNTTVALFYLGGIPLRLVLLFSSAAWIWNDILWHAWPALIAESLAAMISVRTVILWRLLPGSLRKVPDSRTYGVVD